MKAKLILLGMIIFFNILPTHAQTLTKDVRDDFCRNAKINFYYGSDSFRGWMIISAQRLGFQTPLEIEKAVQSICVDVKLQEEFFKSVDRLGGDRSFKEKQYIAIGVKPHNAKLLNDYMILKYHAQREEQIKHENKKNKVVDTLILKKSEILKSVFPKSQFLNDSVIIVRELLYSENKEVVVDSKTAILKQYYYVDSQTHQGKINVVFFSTNKQYNFNKIFNIILVETYNDEGELTYKSESGNRKKIFINSKKLDDYNFFTLEEGEKTFFVFKYKNDNKYHFEYYSSRDLYLLKSEN